jgi:PKD repeat protein
VDFTADGTTGQIEEWIWNFGDGTEIAKWYEATHTYMKAGIYKVRLTVRYLDGTEKSTEQNFSVDQSLE